MEKTLLSCDITTKVLVKWGLFRIHYFRLWPICFVELLRHIKMTNFLKQCIFTYAFFNSGMYTLHYSPTLFKLPVTQLSIKNYHSNNRLWKRRWEKTRYHNCLNFHISTEYLQLCCLTLVAWIYRTRSWGARGLTFKVWTCHNDFSSSFFHSFFASFPQNHTKYQNFFSSMGPLVGERGVISLLPNHIKYQKSNIFSSTRPWLGREG